MPNDEFHSRVLAIFEKLSGQKTQLATTSWVLAETATVLSHRSGQATARLFLERIEALGIPVIHVTEALQAEATAIFKAQAARGISMVDCGNVAVLKQFNIPEIFSFDAFYRHLKLKMTS